MFRQLPSTCLRRLSAVGFVLVLLLTLHAAAEPAPQSLAERAMTASELYLPAAVVELDAGMDSAYHPAYDSAYNSANNSAINKALASLETRYGAGASLRGSIDLRTGRASLIELSAPWIPGPGNSLEPREVIAGLGLDERASTLEMLEAQARRFMAEHAELFRVPAGELVLNRAASQGTGPYQRAAAEEHRLWHLVFDWAPHGTKVASARVFFRVSLGNLVQFGLENVTEAWRVPASAGGEDEARAAALRHLAGVHDAFELGSRARLQILPVSPSRAEKASPAYAGPRGEGVAYRAAWIFELESAGSPWEIAVDSHSGDVLYLRQRAVHGRRGSVSGYVRLGNGDSAPQLVKMPHADYQWNAAGTAPVAYAGPGGFFTCADSSCAVESRLYGRFIHISEDGLCNEMQLTNQCSPNNKHLDFGSYQICVKSGPWICDCADPSTCTGRGNNLASRTAYYHLTKGKELAKKYLVSSWLSQPTEVYAVAASPLGYAAYDPAADRLVFADGRQQGSGPRPVGEVPGALAHELGHGIDYNDGTSPGTDFGSGEAYADIFAYLYTVDSCIARGADAAPANGTCDGWRDIDWRQNSPAVPRTVAGNLNCSTDDASGLGPCGRQAHCESAPASQALFDLVGEIAATEPNAIETARRLFLSSRPSAGSMFTCLANGSDGWAGGSLYHSLRAADDCDGNLANGTRHGAAIFSALDAHGIAAGSASDPANGHDAALVADFSFNCSQDTCSFDGQTLSSPFAIGFTWNFGDGESSNFPTPTHVFSDTGTYAVKLTVVDSCGRSVSTTKNVSVISPYVEMGEVGLVDMGRYAQTITLQRTYADPVVFAQPLGKDSSNTWDGTPIVPRIDNVTAGSFRLRLDRPWNPPNATTALARVHYVVFERGTWQIQGTGKRLQVGTTTTGATVGQGVADTWQTVSLSGFSTTPVILSQVQTRNDGDWVTTRQRQASASSFQLAMEQLEWIGGAHGSETIGWLATEPAEGDWTGSQTYEARRSDSVDSTWATYLFGDTFCTAPWNQPRVLAGLGSYNQRHGHLRHKNLNGNFCQVDLFVEQYRYGNSNLQVHTDEDLQLLVIGGNGLLRGKVP